MGEVRTEPAGRIIPLPLRSARPKREPIGADEPRGKILLYTGVRYERRSAPPPSLSDGHPPTGRRRRS